ncbi:MAG TPA: magnesium transporter [Tepidisphaeraceae bacterium]|nr:magnesium transporter [Tepidisphaeraceae bacterium]
MIGSLLQADFEEIIRAKDWEGLRDACSELDAADLAELLIDLPAEDEGVVFRILPRGRAAEVFSYLPRERQTELIQSFSNATVQSILDDMTPDDRIRLLEELPAEVTRALLETLSPTELKATRALLGYPEGTVGRHMTPEYVALPPDITCRESLERIRATGRGKETLNVIYLINERGKLLEDVRLGTIVLANPETMIGDIEERPLVTVQATARRDEVLEAFAKYDRVALPVVNAEGVMLGIVTADDILDVAERKATEEIQKLGGSEALDKPYFDVGFWEMVRKRGGWLAALFLGEMLTATAMGYFEGEIEKAAVVALFVPLIISSGGNSGSQGTSLIIRSLALREVKLRDWWRVLGRELRTGLALGLFLGIIGFCRISVWQGMSHVPHVGAFFSTQAGRLPENAIPGSTMLTQSVKLDAPVTLPAGTILADHTTLPPQSNLPNLHGVPEETTAYGKHWVLIAATVLFALIGVITWGTLAGSMLPFLLRRLGFDPATSSAPFVATLVDVTGLIIYFTVASLILRGTLL